MPACPGCSATTAVTTFAVDPGGVQAVAAFASGALHHATVSAVEIHWFAGFYGNRHVVHRIGNRQRAAGAAITEVRRGEVGSHITNTSTFSCCPSITAVASRGVRLDVAAVAAEGCLVLQGDAVLGCYGRLTTTTTIACSGDRASVASFPFRRRRSAIAAFASLITAIPALGIVLHGGDVTGRGNIDGAAFATHHAAADGAGVSSASVFALTTLSGPTKLHAGTYGIGKRRIRRWLDTGVTAVDVDAIQHEVRIMGVCGRNGA